MDIANSLYEEFPFLFSLFGSSYSKLRTTGVLPSRYPFLSSKLCPRQAMSDAEKKQQTRGWIINSLVTALMYCCGQVDNYITHLIYSLFRKMAADVYVSQYSILLLVDETVSNIDI